MFGILPHLMKKYPTQVVRDFLCELNPDVKGFAKVANALNLIEKGKVFLACIFWLLIAKSL
jgi:hypothetical protein